MEKIGVAGYGGAGEIIMYPYCYVTIPQNSEQLGQEDIFIKIQLIEFNKL